MRNWKATVGWLLPALIVGALAVWARTSHLGGAGLSSDETFSWRITRYAPADLVARTAADVHPPLGYLLLKAWTAVFGTSPAGLRSFSVALGLLAIAAIAALVFVYVKDHRPPPEPGAAGGAALFAAFAMSIGEAQVSASRNARMYELGILLAVLSALLLLRALDAERGPLAPWLAWGACAAALVYTHYYGAFTVAAQAVFVLGRIVRGWRTGAGTEARQVLRGLGTGAVFALLLFLPWIAALRHQTAAVWQDYWIPALSPTSVAGSVAEWITGAPDAAWPAAALVLIVTAWITWRGRPGAFFAVQALLPWLFAIGLSALSPRSVFLTRYMVFAQAGLIAHWAVSLARLRRPVEKYACALALIAVSLSALVPSLREYARSEAIEPKAVRFLERQGRPGDVVLVDEPFRVNRLAYYADQAGLAGISFRCLLDRSAGTGGHVPHLSSLPAEDVVWRDELSKLDARRVWWGGPGVETWPDPPPEWRAQFTRPFTSDVTRDFALTLYRRDEAP